MEGDIPIYKQTYRQTSRLLDRIGPVHCALCETQLKQERTCPLDATQYFKDIFEKYLVLLYYCPFVLVSFCPFVHYMV